MRNFTTLRTMTMHGTLKALTLGLALVVSMVAPVLADSVRITVNGAPITDIQIAQRAKLLGLEGKRSNQTGLARDELINEQLELQEAKRLNIDITQAQVDDAYLTVARNLKMSPDKLTQILNGAGVGAQSLKDRLKATLAWNQITQAVIVPRVQISDLTLEEQAQKKLSAANSFDYVLKEVLFLSPNPGSRMGQANAYRAGFKGCDNAVQESLKYTDAAVTDVGRRHATQLPEALANELAKLNVGGITRPRVVANGVSMLAICSKEVAKDTTFIKGNLRSDVGNAALKDEQTKYLADLKAKAKIVSR